jgi:hypothetical protein
VLASWATSLSAVDDVRLHVTKGTVGNTVFSVTGYLIDNAVFSSWRLCCRKKWKIQHEQWRLYIQYYRKKLPYDRQRKCRWQAVCFNHQDPVHHNHGSQHTANVLPHLASFYDRQEGAVGLAVVHQDPHGA